MVTGGAVVLSEGLKSTIEILRVGVIRDRNLKITPQMLADFVAHFKDDTYGVQLQVDFRHDREGEAAGWFRDLFVQGESLMATIEWTEAGAEKIRARAYQYVSIEFADSYPHHKTGKTVSNVVVGCALTNIPALKGQRPLALSEITQLSSTAMLKKLIAGKIARKAFSEADKVEVSEMLSEASDEVKNEAAEEIAKFEEECGKMAAKKKLADKKKGKKADEEAEEDEEEDEEEDDDEDEEGEEEKEGKKLKGKKLNEVVSLSEFNAMKAKLDARELSDTFRETLELSEENPIGFLSEDKDDVVNFLSELNPLQRQAFTKIVGKVKTVDFKEYGSTNVPESKAISDKQEKAVQLAEEYMSKGMSLSEAQKKATKEVGLSA